MGYGGEEEEEKRERWRKEWGITGSRRGRCSIKEEFKTATLCILNDLFRIRILFSGPSGSGSRSDTKTRARKKEKVLIVHKNSCIETYNAYKSVSKKNICNQGQV